MLSPPGLPPRWGEGVAPPPTPQFMTPPQQVSPEASVRVRPRGGARSVTSSSEHEHITYEYRFNDNRIERYYPYPNSAESNSPPLGTWDESAAEGSSPEYLRHQAYLAQSRPATTHVHQSRHPTSPNEEEDEDFSSVIAYYHESRVIRRRSALRQPRAWPPRPPQAKKSVQWVSDVKKRPQDISSDRKVVKVQVICQLIFHALGLKRLKVSNAPPVLVPNEGSCDKIAKAR